MYRIGNHISHLLFMDTTMIHLIDRYRYCMFTGIVIISMTLCTKLSLL